MLYSRYKQTKMGIFSLQTFFDKVETPPILIIGVRLNFKSIRKKKKGKKKLKLKLLQSYSI